MLLILTTLVYGVKLASATGIILDRTKEILREHADNGVVRIGRMTNAQFRGFFEGSPHINGCSFGNHSHPNAAGARTSASATIDCIISRSGGEIYSYQMSRADQNRGVDGSRSYYWPKDMNAVARHDGIRDTHVIKMVDVDYYVDMPKFMAEHVNPIILYTFAPRTIAGADVLDTNWSIAPGTRDEYIVDVRGGGCYRHKLWDYSTDTLLISNRDGFFFPSYTVWSVERRRADETHELVVLHPYAHIPSHAAFILQLVGFQRNDLVRRDFGEGEFAQMTVSGSGARPSFVSICRKGDIISAELTLAADAALRSYEKVTKTALRPATVRAYMQDGNKTLTANDPKFVVAAAYYLSDPTITSRYSDPRYAIRRYQFGLYEPDAKPSMRAYAEPLIDDGYVPDQTEGNDERFVQARIKDVEADICATHNRTYVDEFIHHLYGGERYFLEPVDIDTVEEKQSRPTQRRIIDEAMNFASDVKRKIWSFMKREAYSTANDPRPISTINATDKVEYSQFMIALANHIKQFEWYAFGKTGQEIAERVADLATNAARQGSSLYSTDYSRFDGRVSSVIRSIEEAIVLAGFNQAHCEKLIDLMRAQYNLPATTKNKVRYVTSFQRSSGSPETSVLNTLVNAFLSFVMLRERGISSQLAWEGLGIYGGDDGLVANIDPDEATAVARIYGQKLVMEEHTPGSAGVTFLARLYGPNVWFGEPSSCCDIVRTLSKFHLTTQMDGDNVNIWLTKTHCLGLSDARTPGIKAMVRLHNLFWNDSRTVEGAMTWAGKTNTQYPNEDTDWMYDYVDEHHPELGARGLQLMEYFFDDLFDWTITARRHGGDDPTAEELLDWPMLTERKLHEGKPGATICGEYTTILQDVLDSAAQTVADVLGSSADTPSSSSSTTSETAPPVPNKGKETNKAPAKTTRRGKRGGKSGRPGGSTSSDSPN
jgi:hypothetical protein